MATVDKTNTGTKSVNFLEDSGGPLTRAEGATLAFWLLLSTYNVFSGFGQDEANPTFELIPPKGMTKEQLLANFIPIITDPGADPAQAIEAKFEIFRNMLRTGGGLQNVTINVRGKDHVVEAFVPYSAGVQITRQLFRASSQLGDTDDDNYDPMQICHSLSHFLDIIPKADPQSSS